MLAILKFLQSLLKTLHSEGTPARSPAASPSVPRSA